MIFSAPTSAGKSLVADLLLLRSLVTRKLLNVGMVDPAEELDKPIAIYVVP